jgi:SAM-dependent methyltransferase
MYWTTISAQANFTLARAKRAIRESGRLSSAAQRMLIAWLDAQFRRQGDFSLEQVATALYRGILDREPDPEGLAEKIRRLRFGTPLERIVRTFITTHEFNTRFVQMVVKPAAMPDLRISLPDKYETQLVRGGPMTIYVARTDADIALMASLIEQHRFYDQFGVWSSVIDGDKKITAAIVRGLGARSCFELGCFTGPVISLLADAGVDVLGTEVSHLALAFAYPNIRTAIIFSDLLTSNIDRKFDVVLCMDVLEHISPIKLDGYIEKIRSILDPDGFIYVNSPMWGDDDMFTPSEKPYLEEWLTVGDASYWRHWPCDDKGWPIHGHLIWASPAWWEAKFAAYGLIRDRTVERIIHRRLASFLENTPGRRTLFVLRRCESRKSSAAVAAKLGRMLSSRRALRGLDAAGFQILRLLN